MKLIETYLDEPGKFLFFQMSKIDQSHALEVAKSILLETASLPGLNLKSMVKAALLHDIGKVEGDFGFWGRILVGLVRRTNPTLRGKLAITHPNNFWEKIRYSFYVDLIHPARGAHMAKIFGIEPAVVEMIRRHHDPPRDGQSSELTWLQLADSKK